MILITFILDILLQLYQFFILPYIGGGIETINEINDNWNFIVVGSIQSVIIFHIILYKKYYFQESRINRSFYLPCCTIFNYPVLCHKND